MIRSKKYLAGSRGQQCTLRIHNVCTGDVDTVIPAHIRDKHKGTGTKASDLSVANACWACHEVFDGRARTPDGSYLLGLQWYVYALRGLQETLQQRFEAGLLIVPVDAETPASERLKPRKPKSERKPIPKPSNPWPKGRKMQSRKVGA